MGHYTHEIIQILKNDSLSMDNLWNRLSSHTSVLLAKREHLNKFGIWRGRVHIPIVLRARIGRKCAIVLSHSDLETEKKHMLSIPNNFKVFANNVPLTSQVENLYGLPIGLTNDNNETKYNQLFGRVDILINILKSKKKSYKHYMYANFNSNTHINRKILNKTIRNLPNVFIEESEYSLSGRARYLASIRESKFVLCPRGNGIDTHRFWETLYMGAWPLILKEDLPIRGIDDQLPVGVLDSYDDLFDKSKMMKIENKLQYVNSSVELLSTSYWEKFIINQASN